MKLRLKNKTTQFSVHFFVFCHGRMGPTSLVVTAPLPDAAQRQKHEVKSEIEMKALTLALVAGAISVTTAFAATDIQSVDRNGDRFASYDELTGAFPGLTRSDFRDIDVNSDRRVSSVELQAPDAQAVVSRYAAGADSLVDMAVVDTNGDNFVSFSELAGVYPGLSANDWNGIAGSDDNRLSAGEFYAPDTQVILDQNLGVAGFVALDAVDGDGSNFATLGELRNAYPGLSDLDFADIDTNNDNRISFDELYAAEAQIVLGKSL